METDYYTLILLSINKINLGYHLGWLNYDSQDIMPIWIVLVWQISYDRQYGSKKWITVDFHNDREDISEHTEGKTSISNEKTGHSCWHLEHLFLIIIYTKIITSLDWETIVCMCAGMSNVSVCDARMGVCEMCARFPWDSAQAWLHDKWHVAIYVPKMTVHNKLLIKCESISYHNLNDLIGVHYNKEKMLYIQQGENKI